MGQRHHDTRNLFHSNTGASGVRDITVSHIEDYLAYLQDRSRWFGTMN